MGTPDLKATRDELSRLANDLDDMRDHLDGQVVRMDAIVDRIEAGWRGPAGAAYREFHRAAAEDAVRIREVVKLLAEAVRLSRDGFSATDLDVLERIRAVQVDVASEVARLSTPNSQAPSETSRSTLDAY
ncbi:MULTISPECIES: WXG100 family type VII secretion target [unclassified Streptomyces]|uniref:WXG100 family type VII secretion target n=1 Tax=unclassified Streptomyces TaxID=2593676 RepID=UPI000DD742D3|nr:MULTISPECIES: WXG100 family type VII secretion target [unclassified Streptomyces]QZZ29053.1 WXG100 family type VII secretion target [Streptomyces sp. ST1015]